MSPGILFAFVFLQFSLAHARPNEALFQKAQAVADERVREGRAKGLVIAWVTPSGDDWLARGDTGLASRQAIGSDTRFQIGSITKLFTAQILADLAEKGHVRLDQRLRELRPAAHFASEEVSQITLEEMANHRSGLPRMPTSPRFLATLVLQPNNPYLGSKQSDLFTYVENLSPGYSSFDSSKRQSYSNLGVALLGQVLAEHMGKPYEGLAQEALLLPLGMKDTSFQRPLSNVAEFARGHRANLTPATDWALDAYAPAGGIWSTAADMQKFLRAALNKSLPGSKTTLTLREKATEAQMAMGLGWFVREHMGKSYFWHNGATGGFSSFLAFSPAENWGLVVLSNSQQVVDDIGWHLMLGTSLKQKSGMTLMEVVTTWGLTLSALWSCLKLRRKLKTDAGNSASPDSGAGRRPGGDLVDLAVSVIGIFFLFTLSWVWGAWHRWHPAIYWGLLFACGAILLSTLPLLRRRPLVRRSAFQWASLLVSGGFMLFFASRNLLN